MTASPLTPLSTAILLALAESPLHGYALMKTIRVQTDGRVKPGTGTLYAAVARMLDEGLVHEVSGNEGDSRRGTTYGLTASGRSALREEMERMLSIVRQASAHGLAPDVLLADDGRGS